MQSVLFNCVSRLCLQVSYDVANFGWLTNSVIRCNVLDMNKISAYLSVGAFLSSTVAVIRKGLY